MKRGMNWRNIPISQGRGVENPKGLSSRHNPSRHKDTLAKNTYTKSTPSRREKKGQRSRTLKKVGPGKGDEEGGWGVHRKNQNFRGRIQAKGFSRETQTKKLLKETTRLKKSLGLHKKPRKSMDHGVKN